MKKEKEQDLNVYCKYCGFPIKWCEKNAKFPLSKLRSGVIDYGLELCTKCFTKIGLKYLSHHGIPIDWRVVEREDALE